MRPRISLGNAFRCAFLGIWQTIVSERNIKIGLAFAGLAIIAGLLLQLCPGEWAIIIVLIGVVLSAEVFNSAIETMVDLVSPEINPLAKQVKDAAAGAVLVLAITSVVVGLIIYVNAYTRLIGQ